MLILWKRWKITKMSISFFKQKVQPQFFVWNFYGIFTAHPNQFLRILLERTIQIGQSVKLVKKALKKRNFFKNGQILEISKLIMIYMPRETFWCMAKHDSFWNVSKPRVWSFTFRIWLFLLDFGMALTRHPVGVYIQNHLTRGMFLDMGKRKIMFKLNFET